MANQRTITFLSSPEDGLCISPNVAIEALDDSINAMVGRTKSLCTVIESLLCAKDVEIEQGSIADYFWQIQGNADLLDKHFEEFLAEYYFNIFGCLIATISFISADVICEYSSIKAPPLSMEDKLVIKSKAVVIGYQLEAIKALFKTLKCKGVQE